jgi:hypothetical protein
MTDSYRFDSSTFNGPTAVGTGATAVGPATVAMPPQLLADLAEFRATYRANAATVSPEQAQELETALVDVESVLTQQPPPDRRILRGRIGRLVAVAGAIGSMVAAVDRLRAWLGDW